MEKRPTTMDGTKYTTNRVTKVRGKWTILTEKKFDRMEKNSSTLVVAAPKSDSVLVRFFLLFPRNRCDDEK